MLGTISTEIQMYHPVSDEGGLAFCYHAQEDLSIVTMRTAKLLMVCLDVLEYNRYGANIVRY